MGKIYGRWMTVTFHFTYFKRSFYGAPLTLSSSSSQTTKLIQMETIIAPQIG